MADQMIPNETNTFEWEGVRYFMAPMDVFQQFHVLRKLGPVITAIGPDFILNPPKLASEMLLYMGPALDALSSMPEDDCNFILHRCLAVVRRWQPEANQWVAIWNEPARRLQFEDISMLAMLKIALNVIGKNLGNFSGGGAPSTNAPPSPQGDQSNSSPLQTVRIF